MRPILKYLLAGILFCFHCMSHAASSGTLSFSGSIMSGTCDLSVSPSSIIFGKVDPSHLIGVQWGESNRMPFTIHIRNCSGIGGTATTPAIKITGALSKDIGVTSDNTWLFKTGGSSVGFGMVVYNKKDGAHNADEVENGGFISIPGYGQGTTLPYGGVDVNLAAAVSAGRANWTPVKNMKAGTLTAAVTFEFVYR